jgi:hypothetical protein
MKPQRSPHAKSSLVAASSLSARMRGRQQVPSRLGRLDERVADPLDLGEPRHVAGRVVGEVEQDDLLGGPREQGRAQARHVEAVPVVGGVGLDHAAQAHLVGEPVVAPHLVGQQDAVARADEQVADQRQAVRDRAGHDRQAERPALHGRVLPLQLLAPGRAQRRLARGGGVGQGVGRVDVAQVPDDRGERHGALLLGRLPDRGVEAVGLLPGLGRL